MSTSEVILLKNGKAFIDGKLVSKDIMLADGKIFYIGDLIVDNTVKTIDCKDKWILPGLIDAHVHCREPGLTQKEDFLTASKAAAAGGVTTFLDMPNTKPETISVGALTKKRVVAAHKSLVNFGFHFGTDGENFNEIKKARNVASTKLYMDSTTGDMKLDDARELKRVFSASKQVMVHAEGDRVKIAVELAKLTRKKLHLAHISSKEEMDWLRTHKRKGITVEVTPHHLFLEKDERNPLLWVKPELKTRKDISALWKAVKDGIVDTIGTDHAPHRLSEKKRKVTYGLPGLETMLPLMLDAVDKKKLSLKKLVELAAENPAKIFGIKNKGKIKEKYDADLVVVDPLKKVKVENRRLYTKCKWSPWNGKVLKGKVALTIVNGHVVYDGKMNTGVKAGEVEFE